MKPLLLIALAVGLVGCSREPRDVRVYRECVQAKPNNEYDCIRWSDEVFVDYDGLRYQLIRKDKP